MDRVQSYLMNCVQRVLGFTLLAAILSLSACSMPSDEESSTPSSGEDELSESLAPIVPLNTNFWNYWDHYWTTWLPDHPVYEMIELTAYEGSGDPDELLIRVLLTERAGDKNQYFYLNDKEAVERTRANAFHRDIAYRRAGPEGEPQGLIVAFEDKDGTQIEWTIGFDPDAVLSDYEAGLTPSIHSVGGILLLALRTKTVQTYDDSVTFDGVEYAHQGPPDDETSQIRSWYNPDYYSAVIIFGALRFDYEDGVLSNSWGRRFTPVEGDPLTLRTEALAPENFVEVSLDASGGVRALSHFSYGHSLDFEIEPPLPPSDEIADGETYQFTAGFDKGRVLMKGDLNTYRTDDIVILEWLPTGPDWALGRDFWTIVQFDEDGYAMRLTDDRTAFYGSED